MNRQTKQVRVIQRCVVGMTMMLLNGGLLAGPSQAALSPPVLNVTQVVGPTHVQPGAPAKVLVRVNNLGRADTNGPVTVSVDLPSGWTATEFAGNPRWDCPGISGATTVNCTYAPSIKHYEGAYVLVITADVAPDATSDLVRTTAEGGDALEPDVDTQTFAVSNAPDGFGIAGFKGWATNPDGSAAHQTGGHPDVTTSIELNTNAGFRVAGSNMKDVTVELPAGLVGDPTAQPMCDPSLLETPNSIPDCPVESQVGLIRLNLGGDDRSDPVFNMVPGAGKPGRFSAIINGAIITIDPEVRTGGDYGITAHVDDASQSLPTRSAAVTLWGVPADPSHDVLRVVTPSAVEGHPSAAPRRPFITAPTRCTGEPLVTKLRVSSWDAPDAFASASFSTDMDGDPIIAEGCDKLAFSPTVAAVPTNSAPDAPSGLNVVIDSPQNLENPDGLASAQLRNVKVTLPEGMTINPGAADGLGACSDEQLGLTNAKAPSCPESARIGSATAKSPLLEEELSGGVYVRSQASDDPASGQMFRMALVLENKERGVLVKLGGSIKVNKDTGRIVTEFDDNPQVPVEHIELSLKSGPRAPLATPPTCGPKSIDTVLTSWAGHTVNTSSSFDVACTGGLGAFAPSFKAGTTNPVGGAFSPFALNITKPDANAPITGLSMKLPTGLLAQLKGSLNTQVGTVTAFAGPGSNPFALPGQVYLEGAYGDAPFSLRVVVPAKAGPFDLGTVEVRQKIYVDPITAQVTVVSDPLPTIVKGVPVRLQRLDVNVDKAGFIINPTSCAPKAFTGTMSAVDGQTAPINVRFQVGSCASLGYTPKLTMTMSGKGQTKDGSHPALSARLTPPAGDANNKKVTVTLPLSLALDPGNANGLCEPADAAKNKCAANTVVGSAQAQSILPDTLKAPVYFVRGERIDSKGKVRKTLPKLFIPLTANGVTVYVTADSDVQGDRLVTTFDNLPDAPFSTFDLIINGGKHGILAVSNSNTCAATQIADAKYAGQNGKTYTSKVTMGTPCALGVVKSSRTSTALKLTIGGVGAGKLSASGNGVTKASTTITSATTATLSLKLARSTRRALARGRDVKVKVKVAFTAKGQKKAKTATKTVTIHGAKKR